MTVNVDTMARHSHLFCTESLVTEDMASLHVSSDDALMDTSFSDQMTNASFSLDQTTICSAASMDQTRYGSVTLDDREPGRKKPLVHVSPTCVLDVSHGSSLINLSPDAHASGLSFTPIKGKGPAAFLFKPLVVPLEAGQGPLDASSPGTKPAVSPCAFPNLFAPLVVARAQAGPETDASSFLRPFPVPSPPLAKGAHHVRHNSMEAVRANLGEPAAALDPKPGTQQQGRGFWEAAQELRDAGGSSSGTFPSHLHTPHGGLFANGAVGGEDLGGAFESSLTDDADAATAAAKVAASNSVGGGVLPANPPPPALHSPIPLGKGGPMAHLKIMLPSAHLCDRISPRLYNDYIGDRADEVRGCTLSPDALRALRSFCSDGGAGGGSKRRQRGVGSRMRRICSTANDGANTAPASATASAAASPLAGATGRLKLGHGDSSSGGGVTTASSSSSEDSEEGGGGGRRTMLPRRRPRDSGDGLEKGRLSESMELWRERRFAKGLAQAAGYGGDGVADVRMSSWHGLAVASSPTAAGLASRAEASNGVALMLSSSGGGGFVQPSPSVAAMPDMGLADGATEGKGNGWSHEMAVMDVDPWRQRPSNVLTLADDAQGGEPFGGNGGIESGSSPLASCLAAQQQQQLLPQPAQQVTPPSGGKSSARRDPDEDMTTPPVAVRGLGRTSSMDGGAAPEGAGTGAGAERSLFCEELMLAASPVTPPTTGDWGALAMGLVHVSDDSDEGDVDDSAFLGELSSEDEGERERRVPGPAAAVVGGIGSALARHHALTSLRLRAAEPSALGSLSMVGAKAEAVRAQALALAPEERGITPRSFWQADEDDDDKDEEDGGRGGGVSDDEGEGEEGRRRYGLGSMRGGGVLGAEDLLCKEGLPMEQCTITDREPEPGWASPGEWRQGRVPGKGLGYANGASPSLRERRLIRRVSSPIEVVVPSSAPPELLSRAAHGARHHQHHHHHHHHHRFTDSGGLDRPNSGGLPPRNHRGSLDRGSWEGYSEPPWRRSSDSESYLTRALPSLRVGSGNPYASGGGPGPGSGRSTPAAAHPVNSPLISPSVAGMAGTTSREPSPMRSSTPTTPLDQILASATGPRECPWTPQRSVGARGMIRDGLEEMQAASLLFVAPGTAANAAIWGAGANGGNNDLVRVTDASAMRSCRDALGGAHSKLGDGGVARSDNNAGVAGGMYGFLNEGGLTPVGGNGTNWRGQGTLRRMDSLNETKVLVTLKRQPSQFLFEHHFDFLRVIGVGSFFEVFEARHRKDGTLSAVKRSRRKFKGRRDRERLLNEVALVQELPEHPRVVRYFRGWQQDMHLYIQMELCVGGNLRTLIDNLPGPMPDEQIWRYVRDVAEGLHFLHGQDLVHLDIKPENIFLDSAGNLKIGDFGLAVKDRGQGVYDWEEGDGFYVAPELLNDCTHPGPQADIYSFGAMLFEWVTGDKLPRTRPRSNAEIIIPETRPRAMLTLLRAMLQWEASHRCSALDVLHMLDNVTVSS
eukprot:jgi/Mesvir1/314/Mv22726-RA.1